MLNVTIYYSPSSWGHRKYILGKILLTTLKDTLLISQHSSQNDGNDQQAFSWQALARNEIVTCTQVAERYPKNYYAWTHRRYLWTVLLRTQPAQSQLTQHLKVLWRQELESIFTWFQRHVSDHSAAHYGAQVLELYLRYSSEDDEDDEDIAQLAIRKIHELFQIVGNEHETLWSFRRMVVRVLMLSNHQQHQALVKEEIQSVYQQYTMTVPRMGEAADFTTTNIYAWTFLLWCVVHFPDWSTVGKNQISSEAIPILQNHPNISHQMWKTHINTIVASAIACDSNLHH